MRYRLAEALHGELNTAAFGLVAFKFAAGEVTPKSEQEELALAMLVDQGHATPIEDKRKREE